MPKISRREMLAGLGAGLIAACAPRGKEMPGSSSTESEGEYEPVKRNEFFDGNPDYLRVITPKNGEYTRTQRKDRRKKLKYGEQIFQDIGLQFYLVRKGDTISEIRKRLVRYPQFEHLKDQTHKLDSFNIPARKLRVDLWIPIPTPETDRQLTEAQFTAYSAAAVKELQEHEVYGKEMKRVLKKVDARAFVATLFAIAKQEGGGKPLGQFELHRWEPHQQAFSFSYFHVLMKGAGLRARRNLNLTEGQLYHPQNAVKLFFAFLVEKTSALGKHPDAYFPLVDHLESFARMYNGKHWKRINPHYIDNVTRYYGEADAHLSEDGAQWKKVPKATVAASEKE